ncbi:GtrA family protein [Candidatus Contubernalis alkaliaceticus]|uniref:GtrA family protein n=1 Tax=Candidatus Contubernalis alkaliaceticus TaxID=338645 RepID=UPI001F4C2F24|nr:GtrA family protein [Candidatus Contubernalis alkalaceticus]UNC93595.1 GtrA family protein [Candidatus Contubernalis alkalaceticus]
MVQSKGLSAFCKEKLKAVFSREKGNNTCQILRFLMVGILAAAIDMGLLILLVEAFSLYYLLAGLISFIAAVIFNYLVSRIWVFQGGRYSRGLEFMVFVGVSAAGLALNQLILLTLVDMLKVHYQPAKIISIMVVALWNYILKKKFVFKG